MVQIFILLEMRDEWSVSIIDWRYFTSVVKPTIAAHAGVQQRKCDDYSPTQNTSHTLCETTKQGTLVDFLDKFETQSENHAFLNVVLLS